jgi:uncharacterized protein YjbI with pentapeptide repeats
VKATVTFFIGLILGAALGWFLGFLRLPYFENIPSFIAGFLLSVILALLFFAALYSRNKPSSFRGVSNPLRTNADLPGPWQAVVLFWIPAAGLVAGSVLFSSFLIYRQHRFVKDQLEVQNNKISEQAAVIESLKNGRPALLMSQLLENAEQELKDRDTLSDALIARIAGLSYSLKPYKTFEGDTFSEKKFSAERGQLLLALLLMNIDSASFAKIKIRTSFAGADLRTARLAGADLSRADLKEANLKEADLSGANLSGADLNEAILWAANLNGALLRRTNLKRSDLRRALMNQSDLSHAVFNGAQLSYAQLMKAYAPRAAAQWAHLEGALLKEATLTGADFMGADLKKVNLGEANLTGADLRLIQLNEANLAGAELNRALVDSVWNSKINDWQLLGGKEIQNRYLLAGDTLDQWKHPIFRLKKRITE